MSTSPGFYSFGVIDILQVEERSLSAHGWVVAGSREIDALEVSITGRVAARIGGSLLPSPDVHQAWPHLPRSIQCRFAIRVPLAENDLDSIRRGGDLDHSAL